MGQELEIKLNNKVSELERFSQTLTEFGQHHGLAPRLVHDLNLALEEILTNIISYGYTDNREHEIKVRLSAQPRAVKAEVEDDGQPFNPLEAPPPDTAQSLQAYILVNRISRPLNQLADYTRSLATLDFAAGLTIPAEIEALPQKSKDEIGNLAESFMHMERTLQRDLKDLEESTASKERIESELKIAHEIQMSMVPKTFPALPGFS